MLVYEWRELEDLCERVGALRERLEAAHKTGNTGLIEGLNAEMDGAVRQRNRLVRYLSTRLGSAAIQAAPADRPHPGSGEGPAAMPH